MKIAISCGRVFTVVCGLALLIVFASAKAWGQEPVRSFDELRQRLSIGDAVQVVDSGGNKQEGRITGISAFSLTLAARETQLEFSEDSVQEIKKRRHDPWWNGALIGGGVGAAAGLIAVGTTCGTSDPECAAIARVAFVLPGIGIGAAAGALIDYSLKKFDTVFAAPGSSYRGRVQLSPLVSRDQRGLRLSIPF